VRSPPRIVLTGGPGGGKTTAADMIAREFPERVRALKETATILFQGGFPRLGGAAARRACQRAIYRTQVELEEAVAAEHPGCALLCDRGTLDGCVYWPEGIEAYFAELGTTLARERGRYDAVLFFESAAAAGHDLDRGNPFRVESGEEAARLDAQLREAWAPHPRFVVIPHNHSFFGKVGAAIEVVRGILAEIAP
jgi:hypothetical protein